MESDCGPGANVISPLHCPRYSTNTDKEMLMLKMVDENGHDLGLIRY